MKMSYPRILFALNNLYAGVYTFHMKRDRGLDLGGKTLKGVSSPCYARQPNYKCSQGIELV